MLLKRSNFPYLISSHILHSSHIKSYLCCGAETDPFTLKLSHDWTQDLSIKTTCYQYRL